MINHLDSGFSGRNFKNLGIPEFPSVYSYPESKKIPFVILLHSLGKNEKYLLPFSDVFPEDYFILSIRGPLEWRADGDDSFAWFDIKGPFLENFCKEDDILNSIEYLKNCIDFYLQRFPMLEAPILVGFSQGAIISLTAAVEDLLNLRGVYSHCGFYESKLDSGKKEIKTPILMTNGQYDPVIPTDWVLSSQMRLSQKCLNLESYFLPSGHEITEDSLAHLSRWINKIG